MRCEINQSDCVDFIGTYQDRDFDLTFLDPPFNQDKDYNRHDDNLPESVYWKWMSEVSDLVFQKSSRGAAIYFMQREKNTHNVMNVLESTGWTFQNLIIWKKKTSAIPGSIRFGKHFQIIVFATKGKRPRVFNKLRIDPPLLETQKYRRPNGVYVTDVWDDIRELTSGYFAGDEPLRDRKGERVHKQQSPVHLLARIILSSTQVGDLVFDPFTGTGTALVVAKQLKRDSVGVEVDRENINYIRERTNRLRESDDILRFASYYRFTQDLEKIWPMPDDHLPRDAGQLELFSK